MQTNKKAGEGGRLYLFSCTNTTIDISLPEAVPNTSSVLWLNKKKQKMYTCGGLELIFHHPFSLFKWILKT